MRGRHLSVNLQCRENDHLRHRQSTPQHRSLIAVSKPSLEIVCYNPVATKRHRACERQWDHAWAAEGGKSAMISYGQKSRGGVSRW
jgi:hypothetical protein